MDGTASTKKNAEIELLRFLTALLIVGFHAGVLKGGYLGVELFFMLSGCLMAVSMQRYAAQPLLNHEQLNRETVDFLKRKLKGFLPELLVTCPLFAAWYSVLLGVQGESPMILVANINNFVDDSVLLLRFTGLFPWSDYNIASWYLSCMMLASCLLFPLFRRCGYAPYLLAIALLLLGTIVMQSADDWTVCCGVVYKYNIRAIGGMAVGYFLYPAVQWLKALALKPWQRCALSAVKWGCFGMLCCYSALMVPNEGSILVPIAVMLIIIFAGVGADSSLYQNRVCLFLGRLSLPLYLSHLLFANPSFQGWLAAQGAGEKGAVALVYALSLALAMLLLPLCAFIRKRLAW